KTGKVRRQFLAFNTALVGLAVTADGKRLIVGGRDGQPEGGFLIRILAAGTGAKVREFEVEGGLEQLAVRPDGGTILTSHLGRKVVVWSAEGLHVAEHAGQGQRRSAWAQGPTPFTIGAVAASPDGKWFAYSDQEA